MFLYKDPHGRLTASMRTPRMREGQIARLKVINTSRDGAFLDVGAERGIFMPYAGMRGKLQVGEVVWAKLYTDKSGRLAMTTKPRVGQTLTTRITFIRDDGRINVSMRPIKEKAINLDAQMLYDTLMARGGKMPYCDETASEVIRERFGISKSAFKRALGHLMKEGKVEQKDGWTCLISQE